MVSKASSRVEKGRKLFVCYSAWGRQRKLHMIVKAHVVNLQHVSCIVRLSVHSTFEPRRIR